MSRVHQKIRKFKIISRRFFTVSDVTHHLTMFKLLHLYGKIQQSLLMLTIYVTIIVPIKHHAWTEWKVVEIFSVSSLKRFVDFFHFPIVVHPNEILPRTTHTQTTDVVDYVVTAKLITLSDCSVLTDVFPMTIENMISGSYTRLLYYLYW